MPLSLRDLKGLVEYIAKDDPKAAEKFGNQLVSRVENLAAFPRIGRLVPEFREESLLELIFPPYRIVYEVNDDTETIFIVRIRHTSRKDLNLPPKI